MKSRTVIILWVIATALGITAYIVKFHQGDTNTTHTQLAPGQKLIADLPIRQITSVTLTQGENTTHLTQLSENTWGVKERDNYPVNHELLRNLLGALGDIEVTQGYPCTSTHHGRFGLATESSEKGEQGLRITMKDKNGTVAAEVFLGKYSGTSRSGARFLRLTGDDTGVYAVGETFPGVTATAKDWTSKEFLKISSIQSIALTAPDDTQFTPWEIVRHPKTDGTPNPNGPLTLEGMTEKEVLQITSTNPLRNLFSYSAYQDILTEKQATETAAPDAKLKRQAVITTHDGLTYTLVFWPQKEKPKDPNADPRLPAVQPSHLLTIAVSASPLSKPTPVPDETPEAAKTREAGFAQKQKSLAAKLETASAFKARIYQVSQNTIAPLQKNRTDFVKNKTKPTATATPPIRVPAPTLPPLPPRP